MAKKDKAKFLRDIEIFKEILNGATGLQLGEKYELSDGRVFQVFWTIARILATADQRSENPQIRNIFRKEKYPRCWVLMRDLQERFSYHNAGLKGWRAEKEAILKLLDSYAE